MIFFYQKTFIDATHEKMSYGSLRIKTIIIFFCSFFMPYTYSYDVPLLPSIGGSLYTMKTMSLIKKMQMCAKTYTKNKSRQIYTKPYLGRGSAHFLVFCVCGHPPSPQPVIGWTDVVIAIRGLYIYIYKKTINK